MLTKEFVNIQNALYLPYNLGLNINQTDTKWARKNDIKSII